MVAEYSSEGFGITFQHPSHWKLQQDVPPETVFITGEQITVSMLAGPFNQSCDEFLKQMLGPVPIKEEGTTAVAGGQIQAKMVLFDSPGMGEIQVFCFSHRKMTYLFQALKPTKRFAKEIASLLDSVTFQRAEMLFQPVTSVVCKAYYSAAHHFQICYPLDWSVIDSFATNAANASCQRIVKFAFKELDGQDEYLSLTVSRLSTPPSLSSAELTTMFSAQLSKAGVRFAAVEIFVASEQTKRFDVEKPDQTKCSYVPLVVDGAAFMLTVKARNADYMEPMVMFKVLLRSFERVHPDDAPAEDFNVRQHYNFEPKFDFSLPEGFPSQPDNQMGSTTYNFPKYPRTSFAVVPLDLRQFAGSPIGSVYDLLVMNWQQSGVPVQVQSSKKVRVRNREVDQVIVSGQFEPGTVSKCQIMFFNEGKWSIGFIWQSPEEHFSQSWLDGGDLVFASLKF